METSRYPGQSALTVSRSLLSSCLPVLTWSPAKPYIWTMPVIDMKRSPVIIADGSTSFRYRRAPSRRPSMRPCTWRSTVGKTGIVVYIHRRILYGAQSALKARDSRAQKAIQTTDCRSSIALEFYRSSFQGSATVCGKNNRAWTKPPAEPTFRLLGRPHLL